MHSLLACPRSYRMLVRLKPVSDSGLDYNKGNIVRRTRTVDYDREMRMNMRLTCFTYD
ncbi:hypothetical protein RSAG8_09975, partial [Rhizoctonia solani AG-8 WAC10335]